MGTRHSVATVLQKMFKHKHKYAFDMNMLAVLVSSTVYNAG